MRTLKDEKYESILNAARGEFVAKGFKNASMRAIANKAGVGLSNIYNYFKGKDELLIAIVEPVRKDLFAFISIQHSEQFADLSKVSLYGHQEGAIEVYIDMIIQYRDELRLLFHCEGSSMSGFRDEFTDFLTDISIRYMEMEKKYYPHIKDISPFFLHTMASWMVAVVGEIITHDLSRQKIQEFFREYSRFEFAGWRELAGV